MSRTHSIAWSLCCVVLFSVSCKDSSNAAGSGGRGGSSGAGRSGSIADAGAVDGGGNEDAGGNMDAGVSGAGGKGGVGGQAGRGGKGGSGTGGGGAGGVGDADEDAGPQSQAGSGGSGGAGGAGGSSPEDPEYDQCLTDAQGAGQVVDDCTRCLCQADKCRAELNIATHDQNANAVVICSQNESCTDTCCLCVDKTCGLNNYGTGPCASEVKVAAGVDANSGIEQALTVSDKCAREGDGDNSCRRVALLSYCQVQKCASECPISTTCQ